MDIILSGQEFSGSRPQGQRSVRGCIVAFIRFNAFDCSLFHVLRCIKIRFTEGQTHDTRNICDFSVERQNIRRLNRRNFMIHMVNKCFWINWHKDSSQVWLILLVEADWTRVKKAHPLKFQRVRHHAETNLLATLGIFKHPWAPSNHKILLATASMQTSDSCLHLCSRHKH